ncbi:UNVERIFIED_CONTAM: hypothetical protein Sindi_1711200 [Sesamum indicum]
MRQLFKDKGKDIADDSKELKGRAEHEKGQVRTEHVSVTFEYYIASTNLSVHGNDIDSTSSFGNTNIDMNIDPMRATKNSHLRDLLQRLGLEYEESRACKSVRATRKSV